MRVLHVTTGSELAAARAAGEYRVSSRGLSLDEAGFIHLCTASQVAGVLQRFYLGATGLIALVVDLDACESAGVPVRWEPAPDSPGEHFPHLYGSLPWDAIVAEIPLPDRPGERAGALARDLRRYDIGVPDER